MSQHLRSVLLVEDNPADARLVAHALGERYGSACQVHSAPTLAQAIMRLAQSDVDLILLDLELPDSRGLQTYHTLRPQAMGTPVVILTGCDDEREAALALQQGADDYLPKESADSATLLRTMQHALVRRQARATAELALPALAARNRALADVNQSMAHDLRTPLNGIIGLARLVQADTASQLSAQAARRLAMLEQCATDMNGLIGRLLALAQPDGPAPLQRTALDLTAMARQLAQQLAAAETHGAVDWQIAPDLLAQGDAALVQDLLGNLLGNAWKFSRGVDVPQIGVGCRRVPGRADTFFVRDNGIGFDAGGSAAAGLFQPFHRLPSAAGYPGTGLGLAGARRIVGHHGGRIWAESAPGAGATFFFTLAPEPA